MSKKIRRDLGPVHAYALAVAEGFTGTKAEWEQLMAQAAANAQAAEGFATDAAEATVQARQHANSASESARDAEGWAGTAELVASEATVALDHNSETMAIWARNIGEMEAKMDDVDQANEYYEEIRHTLDTTDLAKRINRPNLLNQRFWDVRSVPTSEVVTAQFTIPAEDATQATDPYSYTVTDARIAAGYILYLATSSDWTNVPSTQVTAQISAGTAVITVGARSAHTSTVTIKVQLCTAGDAEVPYGEIYRIRASGCPFVDSIHNNSSNITGDDTDEITTSVITLTGNDIITEADGERYTKALKFAVSTPNTAYLNMEYLVYNEGNHGEGTVPVALPRSGYYYGEMPMEIGKRYTLSCWARVTNGTKMLVALGWGAIGLKKYKAENRKLIEIEGSTWQRIDYEFFFTPEGSQFYTYQTEISGETVTRQAANWTRTVYFACSRKYAGAVQMCGFRLTAGRLNINQTYDELMDRIEELEGRINELEAMTLENQGS